MHRAEVVERVQEVPGVASLVLQLPEGIRFDWEPGAHVDVRIQDGELRQYSLSGLPGASRVRIAVLREQGGRGGSKWLHDEVRVGDVLEVGLPRNHFRFARSASAVLFIAGGIGITPLLPMIRSAEGDGRDWHLHYLGRSRASMPFLDELSVYGRRVTVHARDEVPRPDLQALLAACLAETTVYCCGPERLMGAVEAAAGARGLGVNLERFVPRELPPDTGLAEFEVEFAYSGKTAHIRQGQSILSAAEEAGIDVAPACREGTCGSCETSIIAGRACHLDSVLSEDERRAGRSMMICISRALTPRLVLDL